MEYPLQLSFKRLMPQIFVRDARGELRMFVKQKLLKLKESITVFADEAGQQPLYRIDADRVIDFSARYNFTTADGRPIGSVRRRGMRSLWKAHYEVMRGDAVILEVREANPWAKVGDALLGEIPVVGLLAGYVFHPAYHATRSDGVVVLRAVKEPALWEGKYRIEKHQELAPDEEGLAVLGILTLLLLERRRG